MLSSQELYQQVSHLPSSKPETDAIWYEEAQKRWQAYKTGELKTVSYESVMQKYQ